MAVQCSHQADRKVTPCTFLPWVAADGRRTAFDGREGVFGGPSADRQKGKKNNLIEAAPFGRLDHTWRSPVTKKNLKILYGNVSFVNCFGP